MSSSSSTRNVRITRTTELPSKTFNITKHHFQPIRYQPGIEVIRQPDVEYKTITGGFGLIDGSSSGVRRGPQAKKTTVVTRSSGGPNIIRSSGGPNVIRTTNVTRSYGGPSGISSSNVMRSSGEPSVIRTSNVMRSSGEPSVIRQHNVSSVSAPPPQSFVNMQRTMESELDRRKDDWEGEVEKMQHSFFDMKTSDAKQDAFSGSKVKPKTGTDILTVGDSRKLYSELPDGTKIYRQKFDLHGFDTDDLGVHADNGKLTITASKEEEYDGAKSTKQFNRSVDIPETVDTEQISSFLDEDGILTIEAPIDESKLKDDDIGFFHKTETRDISAEPSFESSFNSSLDPPGYNTVVEKTTTRSGSDPSSFQRTRYLGPDVEETPYGRKLKTSLYVGRKYKPDDITVKIYDYKLNIDANSEEVIGGRKSRRQFARDVDLAGPLERDTIQAVLGDDGKLYLGGSFTGNDDHQGVAESVEADMPMGGRSVNIMY